MSPTNLFIVLGTTAVGGALYGALRHGLLARLTALCLLQGLGAAAGLGLLVRSAPLHDATRGPVLALGFVVLALVAGLLTLSLHLGRRLTPPPALLVASGLGLTTVLLLALIG